MSDRPSASSLPAHGNRSIGAENASSRASPPSAGSDRGPRRLHFDVVIATRNRSDVLALSIPLLLEQSRAPQRLILVDSSDDHELVRRTVSEATRGAGLPVELVHAEPGLPLQRNLGLSRVESDVVFFPDDDSLLLPGTFDAMMRIYERDEAEVIGGVCAVPARTPPPGILQRARAAYRMTAGERLKHRIGSYRYALEKWLAPPHPCLVHGRSRWTVRMVPPWLAEENAVLVEWMTGFRMSFRTESIRKTGFDETLSGYTLFDDHDASFHIMRDQLLVGAHNAQIYHHKARGGRGSGYNLGMMHVLTCAYVVLRHAGRDSAADRALVPYFRYRLAQYALGLGSRFGRERFAGARVALRALGELRAASPDDLSARYLELRDRCLAELERG